MADMKKMVLIIAQVSPKEMLVDKLEEAILNWKVLPEGPEKDEAFSQISFTSLIISTKDAVGDKDINKIMEGWEEDEKAKQFFKRPGQAN